MFVDRVPVYSGLLLIKFSIESFNLRSEISLIKGLSSLTEPLNSGFSLIKGFVLSSINPLYSNS